MHVCSRVEFKFCPEDKEGNDGRQRRGELLFRRTISVGVRRGCKKELV